MMVYVFSRQRLQLVKMKGGGDKKTKCPYRDIQIHRPLTWGEGKVVISQATNVKTLKSVSKKK